MKRHPFNILILLIAVQTTFSCAPLPALGPTPAKKVLASQGFDTEKITGMSDWDKVLSPWIGTPYMYGGNTKRGTDCSGFVGSVYMEKEKKKLPRTTTDGYNNGKSVDKSDLVVGDLVFFGEKKKVNHVGIYIGKGNFMHASTSQGVTVTPLDDNHWKTLYMGARRYL